MLSNIDFIALDVQLKTPVQDLCALKKWRAKKSLEVFQFDDVMFFFKDN
jgi:hypothetical protein